jgi:hypothetical protein
MISFQKNISSRFFQYSDRTVASTETNDTSTKRSDTQLFGGGKSGGVAYQEGFTPTCCKKTLKKSNFNGGKSGCKKKKFNRTNLILIL